MPPSSVFRRRSLGRVLTLFLLTGLIVAAVPSVRCHAAGEEDNPQEEPAANQQAQRRRFPEKSTWETILSLPGAILFLPIQYVGEMTAALAGQLDESKLIPKAKDLLSTDDGRRAFYPTSVPPSAFGFKLHQRGLITRNSKLSLSASYGQRGRRMYQAKLSRIRLNGLLSADLRFCYNRQPDEDFWGIESLSPRGTDFKSARTNYDLRTTLGEARLCVLLSDRLQSSLVGTYERNRTFGGKDRRYPSSTEIYTGFDLPGLGDEIDLFSLTWEWRRDSRDRLVRTHSGGAAMLSGSVFEGANADDTKYAFTKLAVDVSRYIHLFRDRTLVLRVAGESIEPLRSSKLIPFYDLAEIGREQTVRGYHRGRFRDKDAVWGSVEYRYPIWEHMDFYLFLDGGKVASDIFRDFGSNSWHMGYGGGFQILGQEEVITNLAVGFSTDGARVYFGLNTSL